MKLRKMSKKCGAFAVLAAVLLVTAALITSCVDPSGGGYQPPSGQGYVRINVGGDGFQRSILPNNPGAFTQYDFSFEKFSALTGGTSQGVISDPSHSGVTGLTAPVPLNPGFYELTVTAYIGTSPAVAVAKGTSDTFQIVAGAGTPVTVTVRPIDFTSGTGDGTFAYTINNPPALTINSFEMTITREAGNTGYASDGVPFSINSNFGTKVSLDLPSGAYYVDVVLDTTLGVATRRDIVHVHQGLTSEATYSFTTGNFSGGVNITVNYAPPVDTRPELEYDSAAVANGGTISIAALPATIIVTNAGSFTGSILWYCNGSTPLTTAEGVVGTGTSLTIGTTNTFFVPGLSYNVTVEGKVGTIPYATNVVITITP